MTSSASRKIAAICTVLGLAAVGSTAASRPANAWWHPYGWGPGLFIPPVFAALPPPPAYAYYPAPAYYPPPPPRPWIPAHWDTDIGYPAIGREPVKQFIPASGRHR